MRELSAQGYYIGRRNDEVTKTWKEALHNKDVRNYY
jgi:hypothetical protein